MVAQTKKWLPRAIGQPNCRSLSIQLCRKLKMLFTRLKPHFALLHHILILSKTKETLTTTHLGNFQVRCVRSTFAFCSFRIFSLKVFKLFIVLEVFIKLVLILKQFNKGGRKKKKKIITSQWQPNKLKAFLSKLNRDANLGCKPISKQHAYIFLTHWIQSKTKLEKKS